MAAIPAPTRLVCMQCSRDVVSLRVDRYGRSQAMPCGHTAGYKSVPASTLEHGSAA